MSYPEIMPSRESDAGPLSTPSGLSRSEHYEEARVSLDLAGNGGPFEQTYVLAAISELEKVAESFGWTPRYVAARVRFPNVPEFTAGDVE